MSIEQIKEKLSVIQEKTEFLVGLFPDNYERHIIFATIKDVSFGFALYTDRIDIYSESGGQKTVAVMLYPNFYTWNKFDEYLNVDIILEELDSLKEHIKADISARIFNIEENLIKLKRNLEELENGKRPAGRFNKIISL